MPHETPTADARSLSRAAAIALAASTILSLLAVAMHPTVQAGAPGDILAEMVKQRTMDWLVHGVLIATQAGYVFGFAGFAARLGLQRAPVLLGLIAYGIGGLTMIGAALLDGFITPAYAARFTGAAPDKVGIAFDVLILAWTAIQGLAKLGFIGMSLGILGCSLPLLGLRGLARTTGALGLISGVLPVAFLLASAQLNPHLVILILVVQAIWNLAAAALLIHGTGVGDRGPAALSPAV